MFDTEPTLDATDTKDKDEYMGQSRSRPTPTLVPVTTPPDDDTPKPVGRKYQMQHWLQPIADDIDKWGQWFQVVEYRSVKGAEQALAAIMGRERPIPHGIWEFNVVRVTRGGNREADFYAKYLGPAGELRDVEPGDRAAKVEELKATRDMTVGLNHG